MEYIHKNGFKTFYETHGMPSNPAIVLMHGIGANHDMFAPQKEFFASQGYYVIAPDLLAHGKSSKAIILSLSDWADQVFELLSHLKIENASFLGVSMGGVIALYIAANYSSRVDKLIISDSFGELKTKAEKALGKSQVLGFKMFKALGAKALSKGMEKTYKAGYAFKAKDYFKRISLDSDFEQLILARKAINEIDVLDQLKENEYDALVIVGSEFGKTFIQTNRKIADALNVPLVILPEAMDPSNLVNPDEFNRAVKEFLSV